MEDDSLISASRYLHFQHLNKGTAEKRNKQPIGGSGDQSDSLAMSLCQQKHLQLLQEQAKHLSSSLVSTSATAPSDKNKSRGFNKLLSITRAKILAFLSVDGDSTGDHRRVCSYLSKCKINHNNMVSIPSALISFIDITLRLQQGTFIFTNIPSAIRSTRPHSPTALPNLKHQKTKDKENRVVQNEDKDIDLLCANNEDYRKIYGKATMVHLRPKNICTCWNIKGYCFSDCNNTRYHTKPSPDKKRELLAYMEKCKPSSS